MPIKKHQLAIVFPADPTNPVHTRVEQSRLADVAGALSAAGLDIVSVPYSDEIAGDARARLSDIDGVLVWFNPIEFGTDRSKLNDLLREVGARGAFVSAHPDVIDKMGTKEVLYRTRDMAWGCDTRRYATPREMQAGLAASLASGPRVLKQMRGQSGDGIWKVTAAGGEPADNALVRVRHAKRGSVEQRMPLDDFVALCQPYFAAGGAMIDQEFQPRLQEGMIRCYVIGDTVAGFGEQSINALYPAAAGRPEAEAPQPGPRLYFPADRADVQRLKHVLERDWIPQMCRVLAMQASDLPVLWDADFLLGRKQGDGMDTYVLCEINTSSVYPFPPSALAPLVAEVRRRLERR